jgi:hypothetical protein
MERSLVAIWHVPKALEVGYSVYLREAIEGYARRSFDIKFDHFFQEMQVSTLNCTCNSCTALAAADVILQTSSKEMHRLKIEPR